MVTLNKLRTRRTAAGFTLIELMIVIAMIAILVSIAVPIYSASVLRAKESTLRQDLHTLRGAIDAFTQDKGKAPQSLDELVTAGYIREMPIDPFTRSRDTWQPITEDVLQTLDQTEPGITDVHSGSTLTGSDGTPYNTW
jgi:general secretion pathway protein G